MYYLYSNLELELYFSSNSNVLCVSLFTACRFVCSLIKFLLNQRILCILYYYPAHLFNCYYFILDELPYLRCPLHNIFKLTPVAYGKYLFVYVGTWERKAVIQISIYLITCFIRLGIFYFLN